MGLDPGSQGFCVALSLLHAKARLWALPGTEVMGIPVLNLTWIAQALSVPPILFVERVQGRGGWGATQNFNFGAAASAAISSALTIGWDVRAVYPQTWQRRVHQSAGGSAKDRSMDAYRMLFPHDPLPRSRRGKINDNALDALLIATYGVLTLGYEIRAWEFIA